MTGLTSIVNKPTLEKMKWFPQLAWGGWLLVLTQLIQVWMPQQFALSTLTNRGVFFGYVTQPVLIGSALLIGFCLLIWLARTQGDHPSVRWAIMLIGVGALSNLLDRFFVGGVIDYWSLFQYSTFNLADLEISLGVALLFCVEYRAVQRKIK